MVYFIQIYAKGVRTFENQQSVRYGHSTVSYESKWSVTGIAMAHGNLARQQYQIDFGLVEKIPLALIS